MKKSIVMTLVTLLAWVGSGYATEKVLYSYLGNVGKADVDTFYFQGVPGSLVMVVLEAIPDCPNSGDNFKLVLKDNIQAVDYRKSVVGYPTLTINDALPSGEDGEYKIIVRQRKNVPPEQQYNGVYSLKLLLESGDSSLELTPGNNVESVRNNLYGTCHFDKQNTCLSNEESTDVDSFRFFGNVGDAVMVEISMDEASPYLGEEYELILKSSNSCNCPEFEKIKLFGGPPHLGFPADLPCSCSYVLKIRQSKGSPMEDRFEGPYTIRVSSEYEPVELKPLRNVESTCADIVTLYLDSDADGYGDPNEARNFRAGDPDSAGYVENNQDCNDDTALWWLANPDGTCNFAGYTDCAYPYEIYEKACHPPVTNVVSKLNALSEGDPHNISFDKDMFAYNYYDRPGEPLSDTSKIHLQSIQYLELKYPPDRGRETVRDFVVTMSDETDFNVSNVSRVRTVLFGSTAELPNADSVTHQSRLRDYPETVKFNHPGGSQIIGEYLFVALEDFQEFPDYVLDDPKTGVWRVGRGDNSTSFQYAFDVNQGDNHHTAVGVTKLKDETYLVGACVVKSCESIRFYKSMGTSLTVNPQFQFIDQWNLEDKFDLQPWWSHCEPQNMNMVVDKSGDVYLVMFGMRLAQEKLLLDIPCGTGEHDDYIFVYKLTTDKKPATGSALAEEIYDVELEYATMVDIDAGGNNCQCLIPFVTWPPVSICGDCGFGCSIDLAASGTNFEAAAGLWIRPDGKDDIAILSTEHYNSCGWNSATGDGLSRWGVTENWNR